MMKVHGGGAIAVFTLLMASVGGALAQGTAALKGTVLKDADDAPIAGAEVSIPGLRLAASSDSLGVFRLGAIKPGRQIVWVKKPGFAPVSAVLAFTAGDTLDREFTMVATAAPAGASGPVAQTLPGVAVKANAPRPPKLAGFEERRQSGFGHFITQDQIEKMENHKMSEIMMSIPGPYISRGISGEASTTAAYVAAGRGKGEALPSGRYAPCYAAVVIDDVFVYSGMRGETVFDINSLQASTIAGIEFYDSAAAIPAKYNNGGRSTCGLVVIWTR
ncbi:MAG: carboxypeptidase regulatory-like domain-containing protein [Gemmatimonadales bacterium]